MNDKILLQQLSERLPELEWKISALGGALSAKSLPRGLFRKQAELSAAKCIAEIKADIRDLAAQKNEVSRQYLAERIQQKISVLVTLCRLEAQKPNALERISFGLDKLSTRQQWLETVEMDIKRLTEQQQAMIKTLEQMKARGASEERLLLQAELGEVEKRLTLAREALGDRLRDALRDGA